jgi:hypothetical protein
MDAFLDQLNAIIPPKYQAAFAFIALVLRFSGELFSAIKAKGGLRGIVRGLVMGENVPAPISQDYSQELNLKQPSPTPVYPTTPISKTPPTP